MDKIEPQEIVVDFGKICRLCLTDDGVLISLFPSNFIPENGCKSVPEKIMDLMSIMVTRTDGFPPWICHNCLSLVDKCYEFFDQCRTNQATLNESYIAALSEVGVSVFSVNVEIEEKNKKKRIEEKIMGIHNKSKKFNESEKLCENKMIPSKNYCTDCCKDFSNPDEYFVHRVSAHHDDLVQKLNLETQNTIESRGLYICDICGAKFCSKNLIISHLKFSHSNIEKEYYIDSDKHMICKYCGLSYSRKNLNRHLETTHRMNKNIETDHHDFGSFDCRICYRPFIRRCSLRSHIEKVHGDNLEFMAEVENCEIVWNCTECDSVFLEEVNLIEHYGSRHSKYPLEIDGLRGLKSKNLICMCGVISSSYFDATLHTIFKHSKSSSEQTNCPGCDKSFIDVNELKIHLISYHWFSSMSYDNECVFCDVEFNSNDSLRLHLREIHQINFEKNYLEQKASSSKKDENGKLDTIEKKKKGRTKPCETYMEVNSIKKEIKDDNVTDIPYLLKCSLCGRGYKSSNLLRRHIAEFHNTLSPIKCPLCPKIFPRKMNLHYHYKRRHLKQTKKFVCSYCGQSLKGIVALRSHEDRLHRNIRSYKCSECPEAFTTLSILRKHSQRHMSERPMLQCQFCEKKFSTISGIERHIKTHEGVKEFQCDIPHCGKSFYTKSELKRHIKFHTKDFKHLCSLCGHKFMSPGELKKHSTKHTGERPFKCHICSCAYARRDDKVKHLKRVHNLRVKRVYGKTTNKSTGQDSNLVDTIVIDDSSCNPAINNSEVL